MGLIFASWDLDGTVGLVPSDLVLGTMDLSLNQLPQGCKNLLRREYLFLLTHIFLLIRVILIY